MLRNLLASSVFSFCCMSSSPRDFIIKQHLFCIIYSSNFILSISPLIYAIWFLQHSILLLFTLSRKYVCSLADLLFLSIFRFTDLGPTLVEADVCQPSTIVLAISAFSAYAKFKSHNGSSFSSSLLTFFILVCPSLLDLDLYSSSI